MHIAPSRRSEVIEQENRHVKEPETPDVASRFERRQDARFMRIPARTELLRRLERIVLDSEEPSLRKSRMHVARQLDYATWDKLHRGLRIDRRRAAAPARVDRTAAVLRRTLGVFSSASARERYGGHGLTLSSITRREAAYDLPGLLGYRWIDDIRP